MVDKVIELIADSGVKYEVGGAMETTMEGEYDRLMDLVKQAQELCIAGGGGGTSCFSG